LASLRRSAAARSSIRARISALLTCWLVISSSLASRRTEVTI
jgi:hypothetical protein